MFNVTSSFLSRLSLLNIKLTQERQETIEYVLSPLIFYVILYNFM